MPRAGLDARLVTLAAAAIVDAGGPSALTLTGLAANLGVASPSLYKHVRSLDDLVRRVTTLAIGHMADMLESIDCGPDAHEGLHAIAAAYRCFAIEHPGLYVLTQNATDPNLDLQRAEIARALKAFSTMAARYGISDEFATHAIRMIRAGLHGFVDIEARGGFQMAASVDESFLVLVDMLDASLTNLADRKSNRSVSRGHHPAGADERME